VHEVGHALVTRYQLFPEPPEVARGLWWQALNAVEENRVHRFLRRRLPGVGRYLGALFEMDEAPGPEAFESDVVVLLAATATWDRHPSLPFLDSFPVAAEAYYRTEPARLAYTRMFPPPDLMPTENLGQRYGQLVAPLLETPDRGEVVPLEAEVRCNAAAALNIFRNDIWPEIQALAHRDHARIAKSMDESEALRAAGAAARDGKASAADQARLAYRALRAWMDDHGTDAMPAPAADGQAAKRAWVYLFRLYLEAHWQVRRHQPAPLRELTRIDVEEAPDFGPFLSSAGCEEIDEPEAPPLDDMAAGARDALVDVLRRSVPRRRDTWMSGFRWGTAIDLDRAMRPAATGRETDRV
jgi:hypothetical protein